MPASQPSGLFEPRLPAPAFVLSLLILVAWAAPAAGQAVPRVVTSNRQEVSFTVALPAPSWRLATGATATQPATWEADLPGFVSGAAPTQRRVPLAGGWLVVPAGTTPRLEVVAEEWRPVAEARALAIEPVPVMFEDPESGRCREHPLMPSADLDLPRERIPAVALGDMERPDPALLPGPAVRLGEPGWWRGRRVVAYTVQPLRLDAQGLAREVLSDGQWRVRFVPDPEAGKDIPAAAGRRLGGKNDEVFAGYFLNGGLLTQLETEAAHRGRAAVAAPRPRAKGTPLGYPEVRIPVRRTELHRVRSSELRAAGLLPQVTLQRDHIRLYQRRYLAELDDPLAGEIPPYLEIEVPIHIVGESEEFGPDDLFLFWGLRPRDDGSFTYESGGELYAVPAVGDSLEINNENNIYWLQLAQPDPGQSWARMPLTSLPPAAQPLETSYRRTDYYNEAVVYRENVRAITVDRYYYNRSSDDEVRLNLSLWSPVAGQEGATLQVGIAGASSVLQTLLVDLLSGETPLASLPNLSISGLNTIVYQANLPAGVMGEQSLTLRLRNSNPQLKVRTFLDWVRVQYDAQYAAPFGRLLFPGGDAVALGNLEIGGFANVDIGLVEITDPREPAFVILSRSNLVTDGDGILLSLQVDQTAGPRRFYAAARMTSNGVPDIRYSDASLAVDPVVPTRLDEAAADVLVVVHPEFRTAAAAWVEHRRGRAGPQGLAFQVLEPQSLYDWYAGGLKDPWAIKRLVNHALDHPAWGSWALVLIGSANENPRELGVLSSGRQWSRDWVPTHLHVQDIGSNLAPEILASDKWFVSRIAGDSGFPGSVDQPTDLYVGRLPVHTPAELQRILTKIQQMETAAPGQTWRRRGLFIADDAYSSGTLGAEGTTLAYTPSETLFESSEVRFLAANWANNAAGVDLVAQPVLLRPFMEPIYPPPGQEISIVTARNWCRTSGAPAALIAALSGGAVLAHFQGHANHWLLTHEIWFQHDMRTSLGRRDVDLLTNHGMPWLFCGMGCHISDFIQNVAGPTTNVEPGIGEKLLLWSDAGAVASYGSSGYEYLGSNRRLSETFILRLTHQPPSTTVGGETVTSRWLLGELMWAAEADLLAQANTATNRSIVYQYITLGDPLLRLDAGPPQVEATLLGPGGGSLPGLQASLVATDASGLRVVELRARDEAGIDRLLVLDSTGADLTAATAVGTAYYGGGNRQIMDYVLTLPVRPFAHDLLVRVYDSAAPLAADAHVQLTLNVAQTIAVLNAATGEPLDPEVFVFEPDEPVPLELTVASAAWFDQAATTVTVGGENVDVADDAFAVLDNHTLRVDCTVVVPSQRDKARDRGLNLVIDGHASYVPLEIDPTPGGEVLVGRPVSYPNPLRESTRFVFTTGLASGQGKVRVWTVSGREVAAVPFRLSGGGREVVPWDGRDRQGDRLANGTYLYRVELSGPAGQVRSAMQRLVIMR